MLDEATRRARQQAGRLKGARTPMSKFLTGTAPREIRLRKLVLLVHGGMHAQEAYVTAGYKSAHTHVYRSLKNPSAVRLLRKLQARAMNKYDITVEKVVTDLEEARVKAHNNNQPAAMVQASMAQAKVAGLIVDKQETKNVSDMGLQELVSKIREALGPQAEVVLQALGIVSDKPPPETYTSDELPHPNAVGSGSVQ